MSVTDSVGILIAPDTPRSHKEVAKLMEEIQQDQFAASQEMDAGCQQPTIDLKVGVHLQTLDLECCQAKTDLVAKDAAFQLQSTTHQVTIEAMQEAHFEQSANLQQELNNLSTGNTHLREQVRELGSVSFTPHDRVCLWLVTACRRFVVFIHSSDSDVPF